MSWFSKVKEHTYHLPTLKALYMPEMIFDFDTPYWRSVDRLFLDKGTIAGARLSARFGYVEWIDKKDSFGRSAPFVRITQKGIDLLNSL